MQPSSPMDELFVTLASRNPDVLAEAFGTAVQLYPYLSPTDAAEIRHRLASHEARYDDTLGQAWTEAVVGVGGPWAAEQLRALVDTASDPLPHRTLAHRRREELDTETSDRQMLTRRRRRPLDHRLVARLSLPRPHDHGEPEAIEPMVLDVRTLDQWIGDLPLDAIRGDLLDAKVAPVLATDLDGTVWKGDIGDALLEHAASSGLLLEAGRPSLDAMARLLGVTPLADVNHTALSLLEAVANGALDTDLGGQRPHELRRRFYMAAATCYAGHHVATLKGLADALFETRGGFEGKLFDGVQRLFRTCRAVGLVPYAVSASPQWAVEVGASRLGIPPWRTAGIRVAARDGVLEDRPVPPITFGWGKLEAVEALTGGRPLVAMGDSVDATDEALLLGATLRIAVEPAPSKIRYLLDRRAMDYRLLDYAATEDGGSADTFVGPAHTTAPPAPADHPSPPRTPSASLGTPPRWRSEAEVINASRPRGILFLCVANSARSQLAEAVARTMAPHHVGIWSAGSVPTAVRPEAVEVLREIGVDWSGKSAKPMEAIPSQDIDTVITLCAEESCPAYLGHARRFHWPLPDPAAVEGDHVARLASFRATRDELRRRLAVLFASDDHRGPVPG